jgi:hypothetical protein
MQTRASVARRANPRRRGKLENEQKVTKIIRKVSFFSSGEKAFG